MKINCPDFSLRHTLECLVSYICSANNSVAKVRHCVDRISRMFGRKVDFLGREFYGFPGRGKGKAYGANAGYAQQFLFNYRRNFR